MEIHDASAMLQFLCAAKWVESRCYARLSTRPTTAMCDERRAEPFLGCQPMPLNFTEMALSNVATVNVDLSRACYA
jgi:hypothetical protein